jgi:hypothetical protein
MEPIVSLDERQPGLGVGGLNWIMVLVLVAGVAFWSAVIVGVAALL